MKKRMALLFILCFAFIYLLPLTALAAGSSEAPDKPYEKVAAQSGRWYAEQLSYEGKSNLVVGYTGSYKSTGVAQMKFEIREKIVLSGIYIPFSAPAPGNITLKLTDSAGNVYSGFSMEKQGSDELKEDKDAASPAGNTTYIFIPNSDMVLPEGQYTMTMEGAANLVDAFLVKGFHFGAYEKYHQALLDWELKNNPDQAAKTAEQSFGTEALGKDDQAGYDYGKYQASRPPVFALDAEYQIDEIIVSTYNDGKGAPPGKISIMDKSGKTVYSGQSYGVSIENIANASWKVAPDIILPAGNYHIVLSQPQVLSYDPAGEPLFYVKASVPVQLREDFTGTYKINLNANKTSTLMGPVKNTVTSFSVEDFELTVLDKGSELELISQYEGMSFSQRCQVVEEAPGKIVARFNFDADLTKLPYKAKVAADATVTLTAAPGGVINFGLTGTGIYDRAASAEQGADHNTYALKGTGVMTQRELPPLVMTALGKASGAGSIPGPDSAAQAAAGMLFPPLAGVVVSVLQDILKPKAPARAAMRDKSWYKRKYPNLSDEQLAMVMLADAMGSTDNPDEEDAISIGDNERVTSSDAAPQETYSEEGYEAETETVWEPTSEPDPTLNVEQPETEPVPEAEQLEPEPETIVVQTSAQGAQTLYVKDPKTGEWVDPQTNSVLDLEKHQEVLDQLRQEKQWNDAEFEKMSAGESEYDKSLRRNMEEIRREQDQENYKDTLRSKYGTDDLDKIYDIVKERKERAAEWADTWRRNDKVLGAMEVGAVAVGTAADVGIDGLAVITPGGTKIRAGYKVLKGVASTMAEAGAQGKDAVTLANLAEGAIKGGADAALDKIPGGDGLLGKAMSYTAKASLTTGGEAAGSGVGAALRGEDVGAAVTKGLKDGAYKAAVGAVTDTVAGDLPSPIINSGSFKAVPNLKNVIVSGAGGTKIGAALADEYGIKPIVMGD